MPGFSFGARGSWKPFRLFMRMYKKFTRSRVLTCCSVIVEDGLAARTMAGCIDLNPVRAGMVKDPAEHRWCGYGEATGGAGAIRARPRNRDCEAAALAVEASFPRA